MYGYPTCPTLAEQLDAMIGELGLVDLAGQYLTDDELADLHSEMVTSPAIAA